MAESQYLGPLVERSETEENVASQKSVLLALWYSMSPEGRAAIARFAADGSKPAESRDYARQLQDRTAPASSAPATSSVAQLKEQRRKAMYRVSDEALYEFDDLSAQILGKQ